MHWWESSKKDIFALHKDPDAQIVMVLNVVRNDKVTLGFSKVDADRWFR